MLHYDLVGLQAEYLFFFACKWPKVQDPLKALANGKNYCLHVVNKAAVSHHFCFIKTIIMIKKKKKKKSKCVSKQRGHSHSPLLHCPQMIKVSCGYFSCP